MKLNQVSVQVPFKSKGLEKIQTKHNLKIMQDGDFDETLPYHTNCIEKVSLQCESSCAFGNPTCT